MRRDWRLRMTRRVESDWGVAHPLHFGTIPDGFSWHGVPPEGRVREQGYWRCVGEACVKVDRWRALI